MKVLQIANDYFGTELYSLLLGELNHLGIDSMIYVPVKKGFKGSEIEQNICVAPCFTDLDRILFYSKQKKIYRDIKENLLINEYSLVHAHTLFSAGYVAMKLHGNYNIPYIVAVRNTDVNVFFKRMIHLRGAGIDIMKNAERIIFLSPVYKRDVIKNYVPKELRDKIERKSCVIPNGISNLFLSNRADVRRPTISKINIIYAGEINKNKNLIETINACKILMDRGYTCTFNVVGNVTEKVCNNMLNEPFITHYPRCGHAELIQHYRNNDIFVMPSHAETFGLVYAEAMSQGLPVLYTKGQGFDGQFAEGEVGYSVSDRDAQEVANRIEDVLNDYEEMSKRCIIKATKFDWSSIAKEYKAIYEEVL